MIATRLINKDSSTLLLNADFVSAKVKNESIIVKKIEKCFIYKFLPTPIGTSTDQGLLLSLERSETLAENKNQ